jgi:K+ transporter
MVSIWVRGSFHIGKQFVEDARSIHEHVSELWTDAILRVPGTRLFLTTNHNTPLAPRTFVEHALVLRQQVVLVTIVSSNPPVVTSARQIRVEWSPDGV